MRIVNTILSVVLFGAGQLATLPTAHAGESASALAEREGALLHRRLDFTGVKKWAVEQQSWEPLVLLPAKLYVVNLWSMHCGPCINEFPLLKNLVEGWRNKPEVQFLFIADPPSDTTEAELVAFWTKSQAALPRVDPARSTLSLLRNLLESDSQPITLLVDENLIVRQAFIGAVTERAVGRSMERLMRVLDLGRLTQTAQKSAPRRHTTP